MKSKFLLFIIIILFLFGICGCSVAPFFHGDETTAVTDSNGNEIPVYSDVALTELDPSLFITDENGRVHYADADVKTQTGIDVSVFQGDIDWQAVKNDGIDFVMLRVGYRGYGPKGTLNEDELFRTNCENALNAGLQVGVYFFSQAVSPAEAEEEARFVLDIIKDYNVTYPVAYDWEVIDYDTARTDGLDNETITQCALRFCDTVTGAGYRSIIYFNRSLGYFNYDLSAVKDHYFWLAEYGEAPSFIYDYRIWQYTEKGTVAGVDTVVDLNISLLLGNNTESVG